MRISESLRIILVLENCRTGNLVDCKAEHPSAAATTKVHFIESTSDINIALMRTRNVVSGMGPQMVVEASIMLRKTSRYMPIPYWIIRSEGGKNL